MSRFSPLFLIQISAYPFTGVQTAIRNTLEEAIALRESFNRLGYFGVTVIEVCKDGSVVYHLPEVKEGDPLGLHKELK